MLCQIVVGSSVMLQIMHSTAVGILPILPSRKSKGLNLNGPAAVPELCCALSCLEVHYITLGSKFCITLRWALNFELYCTGMLMHMPMLMLMLVSYAHMPWSYPMLMLMPCQCNAMVSCAVLRCTMLCCAAL